MENKSIHMQLQRLKEYRMENPYSLDEAGFDKILFDIMTPREDMVYDEYLDFLLWCSGMPGRQQGFLAYLKSSVLPCLPACKNKKR